MPVFKAEQISREMAPINPLVSSSISTSVNGQVGRQTGCQKFEVKEVVASQAAVMIHSITLLMFGKRVIGVSLRGSILEPFHA